MSSFRNLMRGTAITLGVAAIGLAVYGLAGAGVAEAENTAVQVPQKDDGPKPSGPEETLGTAWMKTPMTGAGDPAKADPGKRQFAAIGHPASDDLIKAWDIDIRPDGKGLPKGSGTAAEGEETYAMQCAHCHGDFGYGISGYPPLVGGETDKLHVQPVQGGPEKTVGSYWPYASTLWDYIHRAMPFGNAQSLTPDEVYGLTAYILNMNGIVEYEQELNQDTLAQVKMPNEGGFYEDPRPDVVGTPCMSDCRGEPEIVSNAKKVAVTPEGEEGVR